MLRVVIESPFGTALDGTRATPEELELNIAYARRCMADSLKRGEAPFGSHLLYPQALDDATLEEREQGMEAGFAWGAHANFVAVYYDRGITSGMIKGILQAEKNDLLVTFRSLGEAG